MFCANDRKFKKNILTSSYNDDTPLEEQTRIKTETIKQLLKELFKKGSIFYKNVQNVTNSDSSKKDGTTYNTYRIKRLNDDKTRISLSGDDTRTIRAQLANNGVKKDYINKFLVNDADKAIVQIYLEKDDKDGLLDGNTNFLELIKQKKVNCSTRKKLVKKKVGEFIKTASRTVSMKMMGFI